MIWTVSRYELHPRTRKNLADLEKFGFQFQDYAIKDTSRRSDSKSPSYYYGLGHDEFYDEISEEGKVPGSIDYEFLLDLHERHSDAVDRLGGKRSLANNTVPSIYIEGFAPDGSHVTFVRRETKAPGAGQTFLDFHEPGKRRVHLHSVLDFMEYGLKQVPPFGAGSSFRESKESKDLEHLEPDFELISNYLSSMKPSKVLSFSKDIGLPINVGYDYPWLDFKDRESTLNKGDMRGNISHILDHDRDLSEFMHLRLGHKKGTWKFTPEELDKIGEFLEDLRGGDKE